jgi:hypothetical protein
VISLMTSRFPIEIPVKLEMLLANRDTLVVDNRYLQERFFFLDHLGRFGKNLCAKVTSKGSLLSKIPL